ncbi:hypothetical protein [Campylobacter ureolyticus]|jgi:hypothetical protein|uniref:hypothetical protein n=1 Tax=Campylobacter ureolyticus TaxID=827 RepID=UPI0022B4F803|nr:hypothetical protein [Campylobacter ureolyticus]MCZ6116292.1 hypothetical protein [Campylobacter ureolyticus]
MAKAKQKKDSGKNYTKKEIVSIIEFQIKNGKIDTYEDGALCAEHLKGETGRERSGHAVYMCSWRINEGKYNHMLDDREIKQITLIKQ